MTCSKCGKKVRGVASPTGLCKQCRANKVEWQESVKDTTNAVADPPDATPETEQERTW